MKTKAVIALVILGLCAAGCSKKPHHVPVKREHVTLEKLKPGNDHNNAAYAYQDNSGFWWYYFLMTSSSPSSTATSTASYSYPLSSGSGRVSLPAGGTWSKGTAGDKGPNEEEVEPGAEQQVTIDENEEAGPLSEAQESQVSENPDGSVTETVESGDNGTTGGDSGTTGGDSGTTGGDTGGDGGGGGGDGGGGE